MTNKFEEECDQKIGPRINKTNGRIIRYSILGKTSAYKKQTKMLENIKTRLLRQSLSIFSKKKKLPVGKGSAVDPKRISVFQKKSIHHVAKKSKDLKGRK